MEQQHLNDQAEDYILYFHTGSFPARPILYFCALRSRCFQMSFSLRDSFPATELLQVAPGGFIIFRPTQAYTVSINGTSPSQSSSVNSCGPSAPPPTGTDDGILCACLFIRLNTNSMEASPVTFAYTRSAATPLLKLALKMRQLTRIYQPKRMRQGARRGGGST